MTDSVNIKGLDKAAVLAALFNASAPKGFGFLEACKGPQVMSLEEALDFIASKPALEFGYVYGRPLKVHLMGGTFSPKEFDHDNGGTGSAQRVIDRLRATGQVDTEESAETRYVLTHVNAYEAIEFANELTRFDGHTLRLGGADAGAVLAQAVDSQMNRLS